ncbi:uncharacterized protein LOC122369568 [Amphibalanus amphitrite]|uniref:uncharacterized protein LOC122369568 n=1 Tax=Amphibalanus amphitrite TaxID=1232801 RepID=UPI001C907369|nr:uncharacterized protein LOC122369568 [Amphibalanus amphitrite]
MASKSTLAVLGCLLLASLAAAGEREEEVAAVRASDGARLGAYSTVLRTSIITSTTATDFYTCTQLISTMFGCTGRRRRRNILREELPEIRETELAAAEPLQSSLASEPQTEPTPADKDKLLLTILTTSTTTLTYSTLTVNSATTVSVTYYCTTSGMSTFPAC